MKKKIGPRRYNTCNDIRDAIDRYRAKAQKLRDSANALDEVTKQFILAGDNPGQVAFNREKAAKSREAATRIEERQLVKLKNKLSEWQTPQLPGVDNGDRSIPVR